MSLTFQSLPTTSDRLPRIIDARNDWFGGVRERVDMNGRNGRSERNERSERSVRGERSMRERAVAVCESERTERAERLGGQRAGGVWFL